jgi:predicted 2-oxoglutarate/Fe(II)-dependent dioxygenase YbiX
MLKIKYIQDDFLTSKECKNIIQYYNDNLDNVYENLFREQHGFRLNKTYCLSLMENSPLFLQEVSNNISNICNSLCTNIRLDNNQIVRWPVKSQMFFHQDEPGDIFAALVYLNDNYGGGQTKFKEGLIEPKVGRLAIFSNFSYLHSVTKVQRNDRYTLAGWYTK